jgi:cytochrome c peroxidase
VNWYRSFSFPGQTITLTGCRLAAGWFACSTSFAGAPLPAINPVPQPEVQLLAPGWGELDYTAPEPGSYQLPPLAFAADGVVLDSEGNPRHLHDLFEGHVVLLAFIYSSCSDINGCPLATSVMHSLFKTMQTDPLLRGKLRLLSLSFDPGRDTPNRLRLYENGVVGSETTDMWQFLTTASTSELAPILKAYDQAVQPEFGPDGEQSGAFSHVLRVVLIDQHQRIRNIYSASFLHQDLVLSDVHTILLEEAQPTVSEIRINSSVSHLSGAGDFKRGYETQAYKTRSQSLETRKGKPADLLKLVNDPPLGLPAVPIPHENPLTTGKIELGRKLFFDRRLSLNNTFSCAMCHIPEQGFTSNEMSTAVGIEGRTVRRNSPTLFNVAYMERLFHDGRESTLEQQVWSPLLAHNEMGNPSIGTLLEKLKQLPDYKGQFEAVFARGPTMETLGRALASYERTLLAADSPFDRWFFGDRSVAVPKSTKRGFDLFSGKAGCAACHSIGNDFALFTDQNLHNTGIGYRQSMGNDESTRPVLVSPGTYLEVERSVIDAVGEPPPSDVGLYEVTQNPSDRWKYRTPTLRNIALTAPYMHNGSLATLTEVVDYYDQGGIPNENLSPLIHPLGLTETEKADLLAFLNSLTGSVIDLLVADAFAARIGDPGRNDPHWSHAVSENKQ